MAQKTKQETKCTLCHGKGYKEFILPFQSWDDKTVERQKKPCPGCGIEKPHTPSNLMIFTFSRSAYRMLDKKKIQAFGIDEARQLLQEQVGDKKGKRWYQIGKARPARRKLTHDEIFKRFRCYFYEWQTHTCLKLNKETNRVFCALGCDVDFPRSKWRITFHLLPIFQTEHSITGE